MSLSCWTSTVATLFVNCVSHNFLGTLQGAERKTRDEERRAAKRKMTATGRKKMDELYHPACDRSEFYHMQDLAKPPVLFSPAEDIDKVRCTLALSNASLKSVGPVKNYVSCFCFSSLSKLTSFTNSPINKINLGTARNATYIMNSK